MPELSIETQRILDVVTASNCFVLSGGAGSGKTYTLVEAIRALTKLDPSKGLACITYTNAAADEVRERVDSPNLWVSTIHDFLWSNIGRHQKELKQVLYELVESDAPEHKSFAISGGEMTEDGLFGDLREGIQYREYVRIREGIISHDEVLILASRMFEKFPKLCRIVADLHPYIFVDEYQDTSPHVVNLLLDSIRTVASNCVIGFFGDAMQAIYDGSVGSLTDRIQAGQVIEIKKEQNRRNPQSVINLANQLRTDGLVQHPSDDLRAPNMANGRIRDGVARFVYSSSTLSETVRSRLEWEGKEVKELNLTHNLIASQAGFGRLMEVYDGDKVLDFVKRIKDHLKDNAPEFDVQEMTFGEVVDRLQEGKDAKELKRVSPTPGMQEYIDMHPDVFQAACETPYGQISRLFISKDHLLDDTKDAPGESARPRSQRDELMRHLFRIQNCLLAYEDRRYAEFIRLTDTRIRSASDKVTLQEAIEALSNDPAKSIGQVIEEASALGLVRMDDRLTRFQNQKAYVFNRVVDLPFLEFQNLYRYLEGHTPFLTQHKTKGRQYPRVLVILDNGRWGNYNFRYLFEGDGNPTVYERTLKLFYVCCTRAMEELVVFYQSPTHDVIARAKEWFGEENVVNFDAL